MRCIAVDDEPLALQIIEDYSEKVNSIDLIGTYTSAIEAGNVLQNDSIDLIFLDIQMPNLTGIEFIKTLSNPPIIIFTTAYNQYALEGYQLNVTDYLLKPFSFDRFVQAVKKAEELYNLKKSALQTVSDISSEDEFMLVKADYQTIKVNLNDILYVESMADYIRIVTSGKKYTALATLKSVEEILKPPKFMRIHRSYIISLSKITSFNKKVIHIRDTDIPIGDSYKNEFEQIMQHKVIGK